MALGLVFALLTPFFVLGCGDPYQTPLMANTEPPPVRVRLGSQRSAGKLIIEKQPWDMSGSGVRDSQPNGLATTLKAGARGIVFRGRDTGSARIEIRPGQSFQLDGIRYAGRLIVTKKGKKLEFVNTLDLETYVAGVIGNEMGPRASAAAYRAQAVTARTYAYRKMQRPGASTAAFHLYDSQSSQVYRGLSPNYGVDYNRMRRYTDDTRGVVLMYAGRPMIAYYASTCGGHTTTPKISELDAGSSGPALAGVPCRWCKGSKYFEWKGVIVSDADLVKGLARVKRPIKAPIHSVTIKKLGTGDWVDSVKIVHGPKKAVRELPGSQFRRACKLRSHKLRQIRRVRGGWSIDGRGWGHGVGMCQVGAIAMGKAGASETEILRYYYPGVSFRNVY